MIKLSLVEKTILENIKYKGKDLNWLVRDEDNDLMAFVNKPKKDNEEFLDFEYEYWTSSYSEDDDFLYLSEFNHLFEFVKFEENEPINIKELL